MKKVLFIDRDGTLILEPKDYQVDTIEKLTFFPGVLQWLRRIASETAYELVMITNQDGLGTISFSEENFWPVQELIMRTLEGEGIMFEDVYIDRTFPEDNAETRKPRTGMLSKYINGDYDLANSYVIGDRGTDMELAVNLGAKGILINGDAGLGATELSRDQIEIDEVISLRGNNWEEIYRWLKKSERTAVTERVTKETQIYVSVNLDGTGWSSIDTGIAFFDHMLDQLARHGGLDLEIQCKGDLEVDEHHTIEDTAIALGETFSKALGNKIGIERYGFCLPMDDCLAQVALDFGGRSWVVWETEFKREMIGKMPTEMFYHFFKSFADGAKANINIKAEGKNEHHKIEAIFKAFAKSIKMAVARDENSIQVPTTKGVL